MNLYRAILRPLLFRLDAESAHRRAVAARRVAGALPLVPALACLSFTAPELQTEVAGLRVDNPVGLAAGMDKNAAHIDALGTFGFGHIEAGTVTPRPQPGNPKPRLFRLVPAQGLINRMGFNNDGVERFVANVRAHKRFRAEGGILGLNIGKNATTPIERGPSGVARE